MKRPQLMMSFDAICSSLICEAYSNVLNENASLCGGANTRLPMASIPMPVGFEVYDADLEMVRADLRRRRFGLRDPAMFVLGLAFCVLGVLNLTIHDNFGWAYLLVGCVQFAFSMWGKMQSPLVLRPLDLHFAEDGIEVDVAYHHQPLRHFSWSAIRALDDIGDAFVLVPKFGTRIVFPKRSFPDGGSDAWAFFTAHGVAGRMPSARLIPAS